MNEMMQEDVYQFVMEGIPNYATSDPLTVFIYLLCRDHLPEADVVKLLIDAIRSKNSVLSNGHLALFAEHCANKLQSSRIINKENQP